MSCYLIQMQQIIEILLQFATKLVIPVFFCQVKYVKEIINDVGNNSSLDNTGHNHFL
jgi:hypothetical protein